MLGHGVRHDHISAFSETAQSVDTEFSHALPVTGPLGAFRVACLYLELAKTGSSTAIRHQAGLMKCGVVAA
jgi:hypothetical protein